MIFAQFTDYIVIFGDKKQDSELEVEVWKMLRFSLRLYHMRIRNEYIRRKAQVEHFGDQVKGRLRWFGHVKRRDSGSIGPNMLNMGLPGRRKRP